MSVGIVIPSFGDWRHWRPLVARARKSALAQTHEDVLVQVEHWDKPTLSLGAMRNSIAKKIINRVEKLIFLDADDELAPDYVENMLTVDADIVQPATLAIWPDGSESERAVLLRKKPLIEGNYIVIGAMVDAKMFALVGGFGDQPIFEDWDLWLRMYCAGATIGRCSKAIYRLHVNERGRNVRRPAFQQRWMNRVRAANLGRWNARMGR